ncbi:ATP synthase F0F1 subunit epsilon [Nitzschia inconspicua]|uniref:ATP synthase F0F1 subunit epsilon n=1 Tax=Nitzschia inconspicua TaxID=303405 RepID=A0A9K3PV72_9STRA|nr:ATP synthase F0F1 subunit epsilon [Nitzschia inconspicua]
MLSRTASLVARKVVPRASFAARAFSSEATADATSVTLNLSVPYESIYNGAAVEQVIIPGTEGEYGITVNHVPYVAQMKPGVLQVLFAGAEPEKYFVAGGYAVTHANSVTDVVCVEAVKLDDIDPSAVQSNYDAAKSAAGAAASGSVEEAEAMIDMEVNKAMGLAVGLTLA